jgi:hypothetical protein
MSARIVRVGDTISYLDAITFWEESYRDTPEVKRFLKRRRALIFRRIFGSSRTAASGQSVMTEV